MKFLVKVLQRLCYAAILLLAVIVLNFMLLHLAPGDPVDTFIGEMGGASPELVAQLRTEYGLDKSLPEQTLTYVLKFARLDMGMSFNHERPVSELILERIPATLLLVLSSLLVAIFLGTFLGIISAQKPKSFWSYIITVLALAGFSAPAFWTGMMLIIVFAYLIPIFPSFGMREIEVGGTFINYGLDILHHLFLPMVTLATIYLAIYSRLARASMLDVLGSDYIRTARAKGLSERVVVYKHALKNAILPVVTMVGLQFSRLIAGAVVIETVFSWPGMGQLAFEAILTRDHPLLLGILFFSTMIVIVANLITDLSYGLLDPRIK